MALQRVKYQPVYIRISAANETQTFEVETDRLYKRITGINFVFSGDVKNKFSTLFMSVDSVEIFPKDFEVFRILFREAVPFGFDYHELNEKAEGSRIKFEFKDVPPITIPTGTYPYVAVISLRLENDKPADPNPATTPTTR